MEDKYKATLEGLECQKNQFKQEIEDLKANLDLENTNKIIETIDVRLSKSSMELKAAQHKYQQVFNCMFSFKAGVLHLYNKLETVETDLNVKGKLEEQPIKALVKIIAQKLKIVNEFVKKNRKFAEMLQK